MGALPLLALLVLGPPGTRGPEPTLTPGMRAPRLAVGGWLKAKPTKEGGSRFRVVEFWATWCAPCKASIPRLAALARRHRGQVDVVGVSVWERPSTKVADLQRFVDGLGAAMDYRVAYDRPDGMVARTWLAAAGQRGIPASFLLDGSGTILWIGHPDRLDSALAQALAGTLDASQARAAYLAALKTEDQARSAREETIKRVAGLGERYLAGEYEVADAGWNALATQPGGDAATVLDGRLMVYRYVYGRGQYDAVERSWQRLASTSAALRDRIDESRGYAYGDRYRRGDRDGAEKAWASLLETASPQVSLGIKVERLRTYPSGSPQREALLAALRAGSAEERRAAERQKASG